MNCSYYHDEFKRRVNRSNRGDGQYPSAIDIDSAINYAKNVWYDNRIKNREDDSTAREELRNFEVSKFLLKFEKSDKNTFVAQLPPDFYQKSYFRVKAKKEGCEKCGKELIPIIVKGDNFNNAIKDPDRKSSYEYEEILFDEKKDGIYFYTDGTFEITEILLDYYVVINDLICPSEYIDREYKDENGRVVKKDQTLPKFNLNSRNDIIDIAAFIFLSRIKDPEMNNQFSVIKNKYNL